MSRRPFVSLAVVLAGLALAVAPLSAATVEKTVSFQLDEWIDLGKTEGAVTLHRIRLTKPSGFSKSSLLRPGNSDFAADIEIQLEFSNDSTADWEANLRVEWVDGDGRPIDGYRGSADLDSETRHEMETVRVSTLKYGIDRAKKLKIEISANPD